MKTRRVMTVTAAAFVLLGVASNSEARGFAHGIVVTLDGEDYYLAGPPDGPGGATDIPGHYWVRAGRRQLVGKHYNTGPFGAAQWWSSDAPDGGLLYIVHGIIDTWSPGKAAAYASAGDVHYHELVSVATGYLHPTKVVWLKHIARAHFHLDGGPHPELGHQVTPGEDGFRPGLVAVVQTFGDRANFHPHVHALESPSSES